MLPHLLNMLAALQPFTDVTGQDRNGQPMTIGGSAYYLRTQLESVMRDPASAQQIDTALTVAVNHGVAPQPTFR